MTVGNSGRVIGTPGRYYVRAEATDAADSAERTGRRWLQFQQAGSGDGVAGGHILATIGEESVHVAQVQD